MPLIQRKTEEEKAAVEAAKLEKAADNARQHQAEAVEKARKSFYATPAGQARLAYERGDHVFQYAANVMSQQAIIVAMVGSNTAQSTSDPSVILNSVCNEGWELVNGAFVFIETGQQSRDKFMSSGQNVAISGATVGYYLFRRCEPLRQEPPPQPWIAASG